jgi:pectin methylesterase-like acyl-CoA thioesterase
MDFISESATVVFQKCTILVKKGLPKQRNTISQSREENLMDF